MNQIMVDEINRLLTIPQYYMKYINPNADLMDAPKQCCPFHQEDTPSFSYSPSINKWRCFGACKTGGDVIELHRKNRKFQTREEAYKSLMGMLGLREPQGLTVVRQSVDEEAINLSKLLALAEIRANTPTRKVELDTVMSYFVPNAELIGRLEELLSSW